MVTSADTKPFSNWLLGLLSFSLLVHCLPSFPMTFSLSFSQLWKKQVHFCQSKIPFCFFFLQIAKLGCRSHACIKRAHHQLLNAIRLTHGHVPAETSIFLCSLLQLMSFCAILFGLKSISRFYYCSENNNDYGDF